MNAYAASGQATSAFAGGIASNLVSAQPPPPLSPINERCAALSQQANDFEHAINALEQRLQHVLTPVPGAQGNGPQPSRPGECPMAEGLQKIRDMNEQNLSRIRDMLGRLAL